MLNYFQIFEKVIAYKNKKRKESGDTVGLPKNMYFAEDNCDFWLSFDEGVFVQKLKKCLFKVSLMVPGEKTPEIYKTKTQDPLLLDLDPFKRYCIMRIVDEFICINEDLAAEVYDY